MKLLEALDTLPEGTVIESTEIGMSLVILELKDGRKVFRRSNAEMVPVRTILVLAQATDWKPVN